MKKIVSTSDLGGAPIFKNDLREVFNSEIWDAIEALLSPYDSDTEGIIVSGCVITANAANFDITAGIVYLNGDFMRLPAATNQTYTKYIAPATATEDSRTFADGTTNGVVETKLAELVGAAPGAGQYITIASLFARENRLLETTGKILLIDDGSTGVLGTTRSYKTIKKRLVRIGIWDMVANAEYSLKHDISDLRNRFISMTVKIFADAGTINSEYSTAIGTNDDVDFGWFIDNADVAANQITLRREPGGSYDDAGYDDATIDRGLAIIEYFDL